MEESSLACDSHVPHLLYPDFNFLNLIRNSKLQTNFPKLPLQKEGESLLWIVFGEAYYLQDILCKHTVSDFLITKVNLFGFFAICHWLKFLAR